jgi:hypothetical protein
MIWLLSFSVQWHFWGTFFTSWTYIHNRFIYLWYAPTYCPTVTSGIVMCAVKRTYTSVMGKTKEDRNKSQYPLDISYSTARSLSPIMTLSTHHHFPHYPLIKPLNVYTKWKFPLYCFSPFKWKTLYSLFLTSHLTGHIRTLDACGRSKWKRWMLPMTSTIKLDNLELSATQYNVLLWQHFDH